MAMPLARAFALPVALLALAVAGCGGGGSSTTGAAPAVSTPGTDTAGSTTASPPPAPVADTLKVETVESAGFSIGVPKTWKAIDSDTASAAAAKAAAKNPALAQVFAAMKQTGTRIRLAAGDPKATEGFATNMNVVLEPVDSKMTLDAYVTANTAAVSSVLGAKPKVEMVDLPAGKAAKFSYSVTQGTTTIDYLQYAFVSDGNGYVITYTTVPATGSKYDTLFEQSAESFRLL
jgi:hypothetical protein